MLAIPDQEVPADELLFISYEETSGTPSRPTRSCADPNIKKPRACPEVLESRVQQAFTRRPPTSHGARAII